jgi:transposase
MRKIREVLRLKYDCGQSNRAIATGCSLARSTVADYLAAAARAGLGWPLPEGMDDRELDRLLYREKRRAPVEGRDCPSWPEVHRELQRKKSVTLTLLWNEYKANHPEGYQYSQFCELYRKWHGRQDMVMCQTHNAGEKLFVDYAGETIPVVDRETGEVQAAQVFVAVLGASSYAYCEATGTQGLSDWIGSHVRAFEYLGGVPELLVPDNLKAGVKSPHLYEPDLNPTYQEMARHYSVAVMPARVRKPRDKAKVESGVQVVERWIFARLRKMTFFSLSELNSELKKLLVDLNGKPFQKLPGSRRSQFEDLDRPALRALPVTAYEYAEWKKVRVHVDYHVDVAGHFYSVPYELIGQECEVRITADTIEVLHKGRRVASHPKSSLRGRHTTQKEHMPEAHRQHAEWTPERIVGWAKKTGEATAGVVEQVMASRSHPQQGFRSCIGIMRLGDQYGPERLEAACRRALSVRALSYLSIQSILANGLDRQPPAGPTVPVVIEHGNIRGADYYAPELPFGKEGPC